MENNNSPQKDFAASVMAKIEAEHMEPRSRWLFWLHHAFLWFCWCASGVLGGLALAAVVFVLRSAERGLFMLPHESFAEYVLDVTPSLWVFGFTAMCLLSYIQLRKTPRGYRHSSLMLVAGNILLTVVLAVVFYTLGWGEVVDTQVGRHIPLHETMVLREQRIWLQPEKGVLVGEVESADEQSRLFLIKTPHGTFWYVNGEVLSADEWRLVAVPKASVRVIGQPVDQDQFKACAVLPTLFTGEPPSEVPVVRKFDEKRSTECRGVRPYERFEQLNSRDL